MKEYINIILLATILFALVSPQKFGKSCADLQRDFLKGYQAELEKK